MSASYTLLTMGQFKKVILAEENKVLAQYLVETDPSAILKINTCYGVCIMMVLTIGLLASSHTYYFLTGSSTIEFMALQGSILSFWE